MAGGVTVAIACYNQANFLVEAVASVLAQTRPADEIIIVDDGSTDETAAVAASFPGVRYHFQDNRGLSGARNSGLKLATRERILFLDADDRLTPTALEAGMHRLEEVPAAALVYGGFREVEGEGHVRLEKLPDSHDDEFDALLRGNHIAMHGTVIYDRASLLAAGGFDERLTSCEDYDVYLRLARHKPITSYGVIAAEYRRHSANMSLNSVNMIRTSRRVIGRYLHDESLPPNHRIAARAGLAFMTGFYREAAWQSLVARGAAGRFGSALGFTCRWLSVDPAALLLIARKTGGFFRRKILSRRGGRTRSP